MQIKRGGNALNQISKVGLVGFISTLSFAFVGTIWAVYLESFLHNPSYVGFLITCFTIVGLLSFVFITPIMEQKSKTKIFGGVLLLYIFSYLMFYLLPNIYAVITLGLIVAVITSFRISAFGIIVSDKSKKRKLAKNEGLIYTFLNLSWLVGPLVAGFVAEKYGVKTVFLLAAICMAFAYILFRFFKIVDNQKNKKIDKNLFKICRDFFKNKNRVLCYILSGGMNFWWGLIYIYMPIYIIESGFSDLTLGYFLFGVVVPLILFTYHSGKIAARIGFRKIFFVGYLILGMSALLSFIFNSIVIIMFLLIAASFGAAMIESTTEAYFFDLVSKKEKTKYYGVYNTTIEINGSAASLFGAVILLLLPFKFIFILFGFVMFLLALISLKIRNIIEDGK